MSQLSNFDPNVVGNPNNNIFGLPFSEAESALVLLPVPWEVTVSYGAGTSRAAEHIWKASIQVDLLDTDVPDGWKKGFYLRETNKKILLKGYHSINTQVISDRIIEPISLTENYNSVCGFEVETQLNKYYNLERITEVVLIDEHQEYKKLHQIDETDAFGFSNKNGEKFTIELSISLRAYVLLKEEYPKIENHIKKEKKSEKYRLNVVVNNPKPITRFIMGLKDEIDILGSKEFVLYILKFSKT